MRQVVLIIIVLFILAVALVINLQPDRITLKDLQTHAVTQKIIKDTANTETNPVDSSKTNGAERIKDNFYIIIGSFKNLIQAQSTAKKLITQFNANIIILPSTAEGYCRISYGKYSTLEEAKAAIKSVRTMIKSDAWILSAEK